MLEMRNQAPAKGYRAAFIDLGSVGSEAGFVHKLLQSVEDPTILRRIADSEIGRLFQSIKKLTVAGQSIELGAFEEKDWRTIGERSAPILAASETPWLFLLDEFPIFVNKLRKPAAGRARDFLEWFRTLRHANRGVRWMPSGSIGLDKVARDARMSDTINDLLPVTDFPYSPPIARDFIHQLGVHCGRILPSDVRDHLIARVGWPIPFHLRLLFDRQHRHCVERELSPSIGNLDAAYDKLVNDRAPHLNWWDERLTELYGDKADRHARTILRTAARSGDKGATFQTFRGATSKNRAPNDDPDGHDRLVNDLLDALVSDGYLRIEAGPRSVRYLFLSALLRDYWMRFKAR